jgi:hypothetical protein
MPRPRWPVAVIPGAWVRVIGPAPAAGWCLSRVGQVERVFWSTHPRQGTPEWRALIRFAKQRRRQSGTTFVYGPPLVALELAPAPPRSNQAAAA